MRPVIVIFADGAKSVGVKLVINGGGMTKVKPDFVAVPLFVVTRTSPLAPSPTTA